MLVFLTLAGGLGVVGNVLLEIRGPGVMVWLLLPTPVASLYVTRRATLSILAICVATWSTLFWLVEPVVPTPWWELRTHILLTLLAISFVAWVYRERVAGWHREAVEIVRRGRKGH